jgi:uncharacterized protein YidB (DUF937 family)
MTQEQNPLGGLLGLLQSAPGAGPAQAGGQAIDPNVVSGVLGMLGGGSAGAAGTSGTSAAGAGGIANAGALLDQLKSGGLASEVESWIGTGANKPVSPDALGQALGPQAVQQLSSSTGLSVSQLLPQLAALIPLVINHLTPNGSASSLTSGSGQEALAGLQGLLGGLANR